MASGVQRPPWAQPLRLYSGVSDAAFNRHPGAQGSECECRYRKRAGIGLARVVENAEGVGQARAAIPLHAWQWWKLGSPLKSQLFGVVESGSLASNLDNRV